MLSNSNASEVEKADKKEINRSSFDACSDVKNDEISSNNFSNLSVPALEITIEQAKEIFHIKDNSINVCVSNVARPWEKSPKAETSRHYEKTNFSSIMSLRQPISLFDGWYLS